MRTLWTILLAVLATTPLYAHVGSADVYYEGDAGPYHLFVTVRLPKIIPGPAVVEVRSGLPDVQTIQVAPLRLTGPGSNISTLPEVAERSKDDPQFFVGSAWLAEFGSMQVRLQADGTKGKAEMSLPVASFARQTLPFDGWLKGLLAFCLISLSIGAFVIVGPVVRDSTVPPGQTAPAGNRLRSRIAMAVALLLVIFSVYKGAAWSNETAAGYRSNVDQLQPPRAETKLLDGNQLLIRPAADFSVPAVGIYLDHSTAPIKMSDLIPDHGHLVHLFLISIPGMGRMWHLHPELTAGNAFVQSLPSMPAGQYQLFADVTDKSGYPWTMTAKVQLPEVKGHAITGDDAGWQGNPLTPLSETLSARFPDGGSMIWDRGSVPLRANVPASLKFRVEGSDGFPARNMEPYMGMVAHAEVVCSDLSVFAHIHPSGTVSMAALELLSRSSPMAMQMATSSRPMPAAFSFPYGFPHPGEYRIFVQIKRSGRVDSAAFNAHVL